MKPSQKMAASALVLFLGATAYGLFRTARPAPNSEAPSNPLGAPAGSAAEQAAVVDQTSLFTARQLAQMPTSADELPFAKEALHLGDQEMDLAFATAVRELTNHPAALSAEAKEIEARLQQSETALATDQALVAHLTEADSKSSGSKKDALDDRLNLAKAQQELDQDEVDEAKEDLTRAGGDPQSRIEAMVQEHQAASQVSDTTRVTVSAPDERRGLIHRFQQWSALHRKQLQLWRAKQDAESAAAAFAAKHNTLEAHIAAEKRNPPAAAPSSSSANAPPANGNGPGASREESAAMLKQTKHRANDQKTLATWDKRIDDQRGLAEIYRKWINVVAAEQRVVANRALIGLAIILGIALIGVFFDGWIESLLAKMSMDRRQVETLRTVTRVSLQVVAVLFILLVIFGPPSQLGTFLGLAGAGLTVALKDFIVGFIGWFVLMGKNGIRLGDWVEINSVTGEVVELGMFHTVLLETGNWTDSGHPTGRRVTFTNSFAIEGHYFNFSTSGQWLWDELQVVLPAGQDPYPVVEAIQKKVLEATAESAQQAEREWRGAARSREMSTLSAAPAIAIKPVIGGVEISVRYVTRASERYQLKSKLNQAAVDLLGQKHPGQQVTANR